MYLNFGLETIPCEGIQCAKGHREDKFKGESAYLIEGNKKGLKE